MLSMAMSYSYVTLYTCNPYNVVFLVAYCVN